ncbi:MAG: HAD family hydrolase [Proteobacteria bacterium]|nr:HAD family hydrolase [Pseudomonadota bacterium]
MIERAAVDLSLDRELILDDIKKIHQQHHDSEYPFALLETPAIQAKFPNLNKQDLYVELAPIFEEFNIKRRQVLRVHQTVPETLQKILDIGIHLVAHTEANLFAIIDRLDRLNLAKFFEKIYCRERIKSQHPNILPKSERYKNFPFHKVVELTHHPRKPDITVLLDICNSLNIHPENVAYVGDSMARDMLMANNAGVFSIFAAYGANHEKPLYDKLVRVTHWTPEEVERELELRKAASLIQPDFVLKESFSEILIPLNIK